MSFGLNFEDEGGIGRFQKGHNLCNSVYIPIFKQDTYFLPEKVEL